MKTPTPALRVDVSVPAVQETLGSIFSGVRVPVGYSYCRVPLSGVRQCAADPYGSTANVTSRCGCPDIASGQLHNSLRRTAVPPMSRAGDGRPVFTTTFRPEFNEEIS